MTESHESTATNKVSKSLLWRSSCKIKYVVLLSLKICLWINLNEVYERLRVLFEINLPKVLHRAFENEIP